MKLPPEQVYVCPFWATVEIRCCVMADSIEEGLLLAFFCLGDCSDLVWCPSLFNLTLQNLPEVILPKILGPEPGKIQSLGYMAN